MSTTLWIVAAVVECGLLLAAYSLGCRAGAEQHRRDMQEAAAEWQRCWLGDPVKASQTPKP